MLKDQTISSFRSFIFTIMDKKKWKKKKTIMKWLHQ